jgi:hypothetical protein
MSGALRALVRILICAFVGVFGAVALPSPAQAATDCESMVPTDINCDNLADWSVGIPNASSGRGLVEWRLGNEADPGFGTVTAQSLGFAASAAGDRFGASVLIVDVTGDNYADLLIGAPGYQGVGAVYVAYGSADGIKSGTGGRILAPAEAATSAPRFGSAVGLLQDTTSQAIVVGAPGWDGAKTDCGAVFWTNLGEGGSLGVWSQFNQGTEAETSDAFGSPLVVRGTTMMVGTPLENIGSKADAGQVTVIRMGHGANWSPTWSRYLNQDSAGAPGSTKAGDKFGAAIDMGTQSMFVVGIPYEDIGSDTNTGAVQRFTMSDAGTPTWLPRLHQDSSGVPGQGEDGDHWGAAVATGYNWWDEKPMLFVGAPGENIGSVADAGAVTYLTGLTTVTGRGFEQGDELGGKAEKGDQVGARLAIFLDDSEEDSIDGIVIGAPGEKVGTVAGAGLVIVDEGLLSVNFADYPALGGSITNLHFGDVLGRSR